MLSLPLKTENRRSSLFSSIDLPPSHGFMTNQQEISKAYEPSLVEDRWYSHWLASRAFHANATSSKPAFSIVMPPPNITGVLTLGHVLNNSIQDILARRARMQGCEVLWLPGTDHAGLATQTAVEKALMRDEKKNRHDLGREEFLRRTWEWREKHGNIIIEQLKKLGCSCDWERTRFTLDEDYSKAVQRVFIELFQKGCIYRGRRMVNWCPASLTAISDEEVESIPQKSTFYYMRYELVDQPGRFLEIGTTRPETLMGDTAVAVHPDDPRYRDLLGKTVWRPFPREPIPIIGDSHIDMEFGTGVLKVTPAHDKADFEIGQRHNLPAIDILTPDAKINCPTVPELHGLDRFEARKKAAEKLAELGLLIKEEPYENNVGFSERGKVPIEPRISEQWFLKYPRIEEALEVVREGLIRFFPEHWTKVYNHWIENIQDWCISRQVWWGHRIPVWYRGDETKCQAESPGSDWTQDADTLDTWFSSWLWAYETMDETTRRKFYPTSVLVTGPDIIFLWVARMIIAGLEFRPGKNASLEENIAFQNVYFTGLIRDKRGEKMSKSKGNSPDPLDLIAKYGADGLRFGLLRVAPQGQDIRYDEKQIEEGRNFANKLWNAARFRQMQGPNAAARPKTSGLKLDPFSFDILSKLKKLIKDVNTSFEAFKFNEVSQRLYDFFWSEYCDWYVEAAKAFALSGEPEAKDSAVATMDLVLSNFLRLLHPYMPHITSELWQRLGYGEELMFESWPDASELENLESTSGTPAATVYESARTARNLRADYQIASNAKITFILKPKSGNWEDLTGRLVFQKLVNAAEVRVEPDFQPTGVMPRVLTELGELYMPIEGLVDPAAERARLQKEIAKVEKEIEKTEAKLGSASFVSGAPAAVVEEHRQRQEAWKTKLERLREMVSQLG